MPSVDSPASSKPYPLYFIGHAGVNLLFSDAETSVTTRANLAEIGREILALQPRPKALVVFSGHFVADEIRGKGAVEVNVKPKTAILHDFVNDFHDSAPVRFPFFFTPSFFSSFSLPNAPSPSSSTTTNGLIRTQLYSDIRSTVT
jgi:4,5-DOPA dioxygenase extradiol